MSLIAHYAQLRIIVIYFRARKGTVHFKTTSKKEFLYFTGNFYTKFQYSSYRMFQWVFYRGENQSGYSQTKSCVQLVYIIYLSNLYEKDNILLSTTEFRLNQKLVDVRRVNNKWKCFIFNSVANVKVVCFRRKLELIFLLAYFSKVHFQVFIIFTSLIFN